MRRKRRARGTWFPNVGSLTGDPDAVVSGLIGSVTVAANTSGTTGGPVLNQIFQVVQDAPLDPEEANNQSGQLSRIIGQEYILQRIVGSIFVSLQDFSSTEQDSPRNALVTAGFFVARAQDPEQVGGQDLPIGAQPLSSDDNYSPQLVDTVREPWIWRRSWMLGKLVEPADISLQQLFPGFPPSNYGAGSMREGTHIDAKSKRRVGNDDRLWLAISTMSMSVNDDVDGLVNFYVDHRVYGTIVRAHNKSTF